MKVFKTYSSKFALFLATSTLFVSCSQYEASSGSGESEVTKSMMMRATSFSGEEIFSSIFFGLGEYSRQIPQLEYQADVFASLTAREKAESMSRLNILINEISTKDPSFFESFKSYMSSNDHIMIQRGIERGAIAIRDHISVIIPQFEDAYKKARYDIANNKFDLYDTVSYEKYLATFQDSLGDPEYDVLIDENMITTNALCTPFTFCAVALALYFALAVHNTVAVTALIYFKMAFWGPSLGSYPKKIVKANRVPSNREEANLKGEMLINEIANYNAN